MAFTDQIPPPGRQPAGRTRAMPSEAEGESERELPGIEEDRAREEPAHAKLARWINLLNIAEEIDDEVLQEIGGRVVEEYDIDDASRDRWKSDNEQAFALAMQVAEEKTYPWAKASNVVFPLMTVAAIQFAARAYPAIVSGRNVVKGVVVGSDRGTPKLGPDGSPEVPLDPATGQPRMGPDGQPEITWLIPPGEKRRRADRIGDHMSWQLLDDMGDWEEDTDKLLHIVPIAGCCFRKTYFDPAEGCNVSTIAYAQNVVINYWAKSMRRAPRISEKVSFYPSEVEEHERAGIWLEHEYPRESSDEGEEGETSSQDRDSPLEFIEQHRRWDLDGDGYAEPYVITVHKDTRKVVRILARFDADGVKLRDGEVVRIEPVEYYTKYDFLPNPEGGIYGVGFGKLLMPLNDSVNTLINQLIDAGTLANTATGFIGRGLSMHSGSVKFKMGEFKVVNAPGNRIREAIVPLDFKGPSTVLFSLLGTLIEAAREVASIKDVLTGDVSAGTMQPTTLMGLIDQGLKVFTGIYKRIHRAAKQEYDKLYRLNRLYLEDQAGYQIGDEWREISRDDYAKGAGVKPVSDPSMVSNMQKLARAELLRTHRGDPLVNQIEILRREFDAADIPDVESLVVEQPPVNPEMIAKKAELEMAQAKARSEEIRNYAQAINYLAQADKASAEIGFQDARQQLDVLMAHFKMLTGGLQGAGGAHALAAPPPVLDPAAANGLAS